MLLEYVDQNRSIGRAFYLSAHLANTQVLLAMLTLTAWFARPGAVIPARGRRWTLLAGALPMLLGYPLIAALLLAAIKLLAEWTQIFSLHRIYAEALTKAKGGKPL